MQPISASSNEIAVFDFGFSPLHRVTVLLPVMGTAGSRGADPVQQGRKSATSSRDGQKTSRQRDWRAPLQLTENLTSRFGVLHVSGTLFARAGRPRPVQVPPGALGAQQPSLPFAVSSPYRTDSAQVAASAAGALARAPVCHQKRRPIYRPSFCLMAEGVGFKL
jgi:hypothetical protein